MDVRYATEGSRAVLAETFTELGVRVVWAETMTVNHASRKVMELGMTVADTAPTPPDIATVEGSDQGGGRYEITRKQWEEPAANLVRDFSVRR